MVTRLLYRSLLRLGHQFDTSTPALSHLIHRGTGYTPPQSLTAGANGPNGTDTSVITIDLHSTAQDEHATNVKAMYDGHLSAYLGGDNAAMLSPCKPQGGVKELIKRRFREGAASEEVVDSGFMALREMGMKIKWGERMGLLERETRTSEYLEGEKEERRYGCEIVRNVTPAAGTFLVAHPVLNDFFSRTVIYLTEVDSARGSMQGIVVNRARQLTPFIDSLPGSLGSTFSKGAMKIGGPRPMVEYDDEQSLVMVRRGDYNMGGRRVANTQEGAGVFVGGDPSDAMVAVMSGDVEATDFAFTSNICVWGAGQLELEVERGFWITVKGDAETVVFEKDEGGRLWGDVMREVGLGELARIEARRESEGDKDNMEEWWVEDVQEGWEDEDELDRPSDAII